MRTRKVAELLVGMTLAALWAGQQACSGGDSGGSGEGDGGASSGGSSSGGSGGLPQIDPDAIAPPGDGGDVPVVHRTDLPPPWQYYNETSEHGYLDPTLGADVRNQFGGAADTATAVALVYPFADTMLPPNMGQLTLQWTEDNAANTVFRVEVSGGDQLYRFYVPCQYAQCLLPVPESEWLDIGEHHAGEELTLTIAATDGVGGPVATSAPVHFRFAPAPLSGALYYWAGARHSIKRANFGAQMAVPFIEPNSATNEYACVSCHSVSRDGNVIAFGVSELNGENTAGIQIAPTNDPTHPWVRPTKGATPFAVRDDLAHGVTVGPTDNFGHNVALSPDGAVAAVNGVVPTGEFWPPYLELRDSHTGAVLEHADLGDPRFGSGEQLAIFPEWSPDGRSIVATMTQAATGTDCGAWTTQTCDGSIAIIPVENNVLGTAVTLVERSADSFHYYPTWSPDGRWVAFVSAPKTFGNSKGNRNGVLRIVPATGGPHACPGPTCYELANGTHYTVAQAAADQGLASTWPKFTPFAQGDGGNLMFISFTSKIDYGFLATGQTQIWMFALDVSRLASGQDASYAPFWIPYQDTGDSSLTPYWTEVIPCESDPAGGCSGCVAGETCFVDSQNNCQCGALFPE